MDSYVIKGKLHDDVWFCSIFKHEKLMNSTPSTFAFHDNRLDALINKLGSHEKLRPSKLCVSGHLS